VRPECGAVAEGSGGRWGVADGVVEVAGRAGEGVDFQLGEVGFCDVGEEGVDGGGAFDAALGVEDEDDFPEGGGFEGLFEDDAGGADVGGGVVKVALDEAFEEVEEDAFAGEGEGG